MNRKKRIAIIQRLQMRNPYPKIELNFSSTFELLIAVLLSAKTRDTIVNKVTTKLYNIANTPEEIVKLGIEKLQNYINPVGLSRKKTENVIKICRILLECYDGEVPKNRESLESLPGVGRKVANVVLNTAFGFPTIAVDTHVFRVCNRTNFAPGETVKKVEEKLLKVVPKKFKVNCHHWLILHGRYICLSRKPLCGSCIINDLCEFEKLALYTN